MSTLDKLREQAKQRGYEHNAWFLFTDKITNNPIQLMAMRISNDEELDYFISQKNEKWNIHQISYDKYCQMLKII